MGGTHSRNKGHNFERFLAEEFRQLGFPDAKRHLEMQGELVELGIDLDGTYPFKVQAKRYKDYVPMNKIFEVKAQEGCYPLLVSKGDRAEALAVMYWNDLKELIAMLKKEGIL